MAGTHTEYHKKNFIIIIFLNLNASPYRYFIITIFAQIVSTSNTIQCRLKENLTSKQTSMSF